MTKIEFVDQFNGKPFLFNGDTFEGMDCIGLCRLFYKLNGWKETFKDGKPVEQGWYNTEPNRLYRYLLANFDKTDDYRQLKYGDIVLFLIRGESHIGIYIPEGKILHNFPPISETIQTVSHIDRFKYLEPYFRAGFRRRE